MIGRAAGTTSSSGLSGVRTTRGAASSGSQRAIGSSSATSPSSTSSISAAAVIGFVIEAIRKIESALELAGGRDLDVVAARDERGGARRDAARDGALEEVLRGAQ